MSDRDKLAQQFEIAGQALLEISRIMKVMSEHDKTISKKEYALKMKEARLKTKSEMVLQDLNKPFPETNPEVLTMLRKAKENL